MIKGYRANNLVSLYKVATDALLEGRFISNMLSTNFSEFEREDVEQESLEEVFVKLLEDMHGLRHIGPVIFWLLNENMPEQQRVGYVEDFLIKLSEVDYTLEKFVVGMRQLASGRFGSNGREVFDSIISNGKVKELLDSKLDSGLEGSSYKLYNLKELSSYFSSRYISTINTAIDKIVEGDIDWKVSNSLISSITGSGYVNSDLKEYIFNETFEKIKVLVEYIESSGYIFNKDTITMGLIDTFGNLLNEDIVNRLNTTLIDTGSVFPDGSAGTEMFVGQTKDAIRTGDLYRLYNVLNIDTNLPRYEKSIVMHTLRSAETPENIENFENNFVSTFISFKLNEKFPDILDELVKVMAEKFPRNFLGMTYTPRMTEALFENYHDKYLSTAYSSLLATSPNDFINLLRSDDTDSEKKDIMRQTLKENVSDESSLNKINLLKLANAFKYFIEELEEDSHKRMLFTSLLNNMDNSICDALADGLYTMSVRDDHAGDEELKQDFVKKLYIKIEANIELYYKCFLKNNYKFYYPFLDNISRRLKKKALELVIEKKDSVTYFNHFYDNGDPASEIFQNSLKMLEKVSDRERALDIHRRSHNDIDVEPVFGSRVKYSQYQTQQRPSELTEADIDRYDLTQDNTEPTPIMYDINKNHVSAADFVMHTNLGSSGFTSAWALSSFPEDKLLIEQIQSDYPVVLDRVFNRMPPTKKSYRSISYKSTTGADYRLSYKDDGGAYAEFQSGEISPEIEEKMTDEGLEVMSPEEFNDYTNKANEFDVPYDASESKKIEAYTKSSEVYRDRAREIRKRLDEYGLIPASLYSLKAKYSEEERGDAKKHIEIISQNYPYLIIANTMKTAQNMGMDAVYLLKSGGSAIQNKNKRRKIYEELPEALGAEDDTILGLEVFRLPANSESIEKVKSLMPIRKKGGYNYSLTPSQNGVIISRRREEQRSLRRSDLEKRDEELSVDKYLEGERLIKGLFDEAGLAYAGPEQDSITGLLRYLGSNESALRQRGISKGRLKKLKVRIVNLRFAEIIEEYGLTKFGLQKIVPLYNLLIKNNMMNEAEELQILVDNVSVNKNLLLGRN